jgi:hypothetical protein
MKYWGAAGMMTGDPDNPGWLEDSWDEALHQARCLKDFGHWLRTPPGRRKLFAAYCRHSVPDQWDRFLESGEPPFIFPSREKLDAHLEHCQLCGAQLQLAELRRRRSARGVSRSEDQPLVELYESFCNEALAAVCDPAEWSPDAVSSPPRVWRQSPPWRLATGDAILPAPGQAELPLRLIGPASPGCIEICISTQLIRCPDRELGPLEFLVGGEGDPQQIPWRPDSSGLMAFPLPAHGHFAPGRLIVRYAVRPLPDDDVMPAEMAVGALTLEIPERP